MVVAGGVAVVADGDVVDVTVVGCGGGAFGGGFLFQNKIDMTIMR